MVRNIAWASPGDPVRSLRLDGLHATGLKLEAILNGRSSVPAAPIPFGYGSSIGKRSEAEEGRRAFVGHPEPLSVEIAESLGPKEPAQGSVHDEAKILVPSLEAQSNGFVGEKAVKND